MGSDLTTLARELVASPAWRGWQEGMLARDGRQTVRVVGPNGFAIAGDSLHTYGDSRTDSRDYPDLSDPATVGVLLEWLPEPWAAIRSGERFGVRQGEDGWGGSRLGEAVARALIAAGGHRG